MTEFVETEALLAALQGDEVEVVRIVEGMLPTERDALQAAAWMVQLVCVSRCDICDRYLSVHSGEYQRTSPSLRERGVIHHKTCPLPEA